ncbi:MAG: hypothetical protein CMM01_01630 [Rhodopirellula sp.]|nr:hypothetical protein [Rhodopirellula sp.]OUX52407.1 MAG: hypothetical protein CBE43_00785 [Rhodopirellula sp. TMED283]
MPTKSSVPPQSWGIGEFNDKSMIHNIPVVTACPAARTTRTRLGVHADVTASRGFLHPPKRSLQAQKL